MDRAQRGSYLRSLNLVPDILLLTHREYRCSRGPPFVAGCIGNENMLAPVLKLCAPLGPEKVPIPVDSSRDRTSDRFPEVARFPLRKCCTGAPRFKNRIRF